MGNEIKKLVSHYVKLYKTSNPFELADCLNIKVFDVPLGSVMGYYKYLKRHRCIYINSEIENYNFKNVVMAHELGHAIMHRNENCYFMSSKTLLLTSKIERQANEFAAELLLSDDLIEEFGNYTIEQVSCLTGIDINLVKLKNWVM